MRLIRKRYLGIGVALGAIGLSASLVATNAFAGPVSAVSQDDADALRAAAKSTGSVVATRDGDATEQFGSGSTKRGAKDVPDADDEFRIGSNTKMFVSTVLLQLVDEGKLDLDAPIGKYLPGLVTGKGLDENAITVRNLQQHTSGVADNLTTDVIIDPTLQLFPPKAEKMVGKGTRHGSQFEPGSKWEYSNTNYSILGLLVEKLTGQRIGEAIDERISKPLGLEETKFAYPGEKKIKEPHFSGYVGISPVLLDVSGHEPGIWTAAGALLSSGSDMNVFLNSLLNGKLMSAESLKAMQTTFGDSHYGLGIGQMETSCGTAWGHSGNVLGYSSFAYSNGSGKSVFAAINTSANPVEQVEKLVDSALCGDDAGKATLPDNVIEENDNAVKAAEQYAKAKD